MEKKFTERYKLIHKARVDGGFLKVILFIHNGFCKTKPRTTSFFKSYTQQENKMCITFEQPVFLCKSTTETKNKREARKKLSTAYP